ncbi:MAG TPA: hypothetical protein VKM54_25060 [Myxococcota bacterium]|nr:hypothetical protein [Myxococcota bacterium]
MFCVGIALGVYCARHTGCAQQFKQEEQSAKTMPINCGTAQGDLRVLQSEKANVVQPVAMGVTMIYPASAVIGILTGVEGTKYQVATGEYNAAIDKKIAEIKSTCGLTAE